MHGVLDKVDLWQVGIVIFGYTPVSSRNKTDCHYIAEILLKVALIHLTLTHKTSELPEFQITRFYCMLNVYLFTIDVYYS
jgi:hypothetical protein